LESGALTIEIDGVAHPEKMQRADGTPREILGAGIAMCPPAP
jgi:hypothetical protein